MAGLITGVLHSSLTAIFLIAEITGGYKLFVPYLCDMKYLIWLFFIASIGSILTGFFFELDYSEKLIGFGVVGLFLVVFPLFSYYRWKDKNMKDYMLTNENLKKMRDYKD